MDRTRRDRPEDKVRTSQLIQQLAAQRERKLQGTTASSSTAHSSTPDEVVAASSIPLPGSFDEEDTAQTPAGKPRSRLVRQDRAKQQTPHQTHGSGVGDVDGLADLLQGVGLSSNSGSNRSGRQPAQQQQKQGSNGGSSSAEHAIEDEEVDSDGSSPAAAAAAAATQRRRTAGPASCSRTSAGAHTAVLECDHEASDAAEQEDVASVDSAADSDGEQAAASSSSAQQQQQQRHQDAAGGSSSSTATAAPAAEPLVLEGGFRLDGAVARKLYPHQIQGVKWLWSLHSMGKGGILADDMGLGKTMQCSAFLAGALAASRSSSSGGLQTSAHNPAGAGAGAGAAPAAAAAAEQTSAAPVPVRALIVAPKTLLAHWEKELRVCGMGRATHSFYGSSEGERATVLTTITRRGGIMLTTYGMVLHNASQLMAGRGSAVARDIDEHEDEEDLLCPDPPPGRRILWDYIILDEGHKIKNARTQLAQRLREIRARVRIIISGTPVQNNLGELHALMEFATPGLLGSAKDFKGGYEKPINAGQDRSATLRVRELGAARAAELRQLVSPYILRREKKEVLGDGTTTNSGSTGHGVTTSSTGGGSSILSGTAGVVAVAAVGPAGSSGVSSGDAPASSAAATAGGGGGASGPAPMGKKTDLVVWLRLTPLQRHIYEAFLHSDAVKAALNSSKSPLAALTVLKKVCDHPALLSERATKLVVSAASKPSRRKGLETTTTSSKQPGGKVKRRTSMDDFIVDDSDSGSNGEGHGRRSAAAEGSSGGSAYEEAGEAEEAEEDESSGSESDDSSRARLGSKAAARAAVAASLDNFSEEFLSWATAKGGEDLEQKLLSDVGARGTDSSCKSQFVAALLDELVAGGHRTLVFSQSRVMLDILQAAVKACGWNFCRIDGSMARAEARQAEVERFQTAVGGAKGIPVFLLTTQVGGLGLTLTAADRVVIVDPSWNPATDNQSVDRAYRIGQSRDVVVYRLVTCGTVEEKIYRKQVFKGGLSKAGMEEGIQLRYFTHQELHELFKWDPAALHTSETQQLLKQQHAQQLRALQQQQSTELTSHMLWVEDNPLCAGTSQHGLLFSLEDPEGKQLNLAAADRCNGGGSSSRQQAGGGRFRDSGWHPRTGAAGGSASSGQAGRFRGLDAAAGGSGGGGAQPSAAALDEMMQSLHIGPSGSGRGGLTAAAAARSTTGLFPPGSTGRLQPQQQQQAQVQELSKRIKQLQAQIQRTSTDLTLMGPSLPDGGAKLAVRVDSLQADLQQAQAQLTQLDPQAAAALTAAVAASSGKPPHAAAGAAQQQLAQQPPWQQQARQPLAQSPPWQQRQPPPPPQQQQQQHHWPDDLPQPPPPPGRPQQQQNPARPGLGHTPAQGSHACAFVGARDQQPPQQQQPSPPDVQTLDGRVPTVDELKQRKHVLKRALAKEDMVKDQLKAQGREYPADKQQQWVQMYIEYKEIKQVLQAVEEAEAAKQDAGGGGGSGRQQGGGSTVIDLT